MRRIPLRWVTFSLLVLLSACDSEAEVENTIPANGQFGVDPRTIVAVRLSSTMSSTDLEKNVDTRNITVFGDQTEGAYSGTIQPARFSNLFGGQTIEQFVAGQTSPDPNAPPPQEAEEEANTDLDALVFLLEQGAQFKPGERVTVVVDSRVTVRGSAMNSSTSFTFTIAGGSAPAAGEFFVETVDPSTEMTTVGLSPDVRATFSMAAQTSTLADGIRVRGDQSGLHPEGTTLAGSGNTTTEVIRRLEADDAFIPGERVTVTFGPGIRASGDVRLSPFALRFQAKPGAISGLLEGETGWNDQILDASGMEPLGIVAADFRTQVAGVEIAAVYADRVTLFVQTAPFVWTPLDTTFVPGGTVRGVVASDTNDDGVSELVVVIERNGGGGRLSRFEVGDDGDFGALGDPFDFPAGAIHAVALADLDASGSPELVVAHGDTTFVPTGPGGTPGQATRTGTITFFESRQGAGAELDPTNPEALLEFGWARIHRPISTFESARRIELEDLDRDGRIDLIAETDRGLVLYRNQSSPTTPFSFRRVGLLSGPNGDPVVPESWAAFDIDRDGDIDIVSWVGGQSLFHENRQPARDEIEPGAPPAGLLFESIPPESFTLANVPTQGSLVLASNLDGDDLGAPDLVVTRPNGTIDIHVGSPDAIFAFETPRSYAGAAGSALAVIADIDGDTALDVVRVTAQGIRALISDSTLVDPVEVPARSQYRLVLDVEDENTIAVRAIGDIASRFSGYSLALDYDETVLEYLGFVIPSEFERKATFTLCPNLQLLGCSGVAGARMEYQRDTVGAPTEDLLLGTFRFRLRTVEDETETTIELRDFESGNQTFNNSVMTKVGAFSQEILVTDLGDPIEIVVEPPAPEPGPELSITCSVVERLAKSYRARIEWSSPRGTEFERVVVTVNGKPIADENGPIGPVDWNRSNVTFLDDSAASVAVEVEALLSGQEPGDSMAPVETCELVSVYQPEVICESRTGSNVVRWTLEEHEADSFRIYRNGVRIGTVAGGSDFVFEDRFPSPDGADSYEVSAVLLGVEGPRGFCRGQDPTPCFTHDPVALAAGVEPRNSPSSPNVLRFRWRNGEAYDRLVARLEFTPSGGGTSEEMFPGGQELDGALTELTFDGDRDRGGARPGTYIFRLQGFAFPAPGSSCEGQETIPTTEIVFPSVVVAPPTLADAGFVCSRDGSGAIALSWQPLWRGFNDFLRVDVEHDLDGEVETTEIRGILLSERALLIDELDGAPLEPFGTYRFRLIATFQAQDFVAECGPIAFEPSVVIDDVEVGVALSGAEIPIRAIGVNGVIDQWEVTLEIPDWLVVVDAIAEPAGSGLQRVFLSASGTFRPGLDGFDDDEVELARLRVDVPSNLALAGRTEPITVSSARMRIRGTTSLRSVAADSGALHVRERWVALDHAEVEAGSDEAIRIAVRTTFTAPPGVPDYKFNAFQIHIAFDHERLELLPFRVEDQQSTAIAGRGLLVFPDTSTLKVANTFGFAKYAWLGFDLANPTQPQFLEPVTNKELIVLRFRSRVGASEPGGFGSIAFVTNPTADQPTAFFPVEDVPGVPDMEAFIHGGIDILSDAEELVVASLSPARGALTGGNVVRVRGRGLPTDPADLESIELVSLAGDPIAADLDKVDFVSDEELRFVVPDSGLRSQTFFGRRVFNFRLTTSTGAVVLARSYTYEAPSIASSDVTSVRATQNDFVTLSGQGLAVGATAEFVVAGTTYLADIFRIEPDGSRLILVASQLPVPEPGQTIEADLRVHLPDGGTLSPPARFRILPPTEEPDFAVFSLEPSRAGYCGGTIVTVLGQGFTSGTKVTFGSAGEIGIELVNAREMRFVVPETDDVGPITVRISELGIPIDVAFILDPPVDFIRGDVNGDGAVAMEDATLLSQIVVGGAMPSSPDINRDAWDVTDDGAIDFGDSIWLLRYLFEGGAPPPAPFPEAGQDPDNRSDGICQ